MEIQTPATILLKFCTQRPYLFKEGFGYGLTPASFPILGLGGTETLKAEEHIFETCLQCKRCSAGYKLTRAVGSN